MKLRWIERKVYKTVSGHSDVGIITTVKVLQYLDTKGTFFTCFKGRWVDVPTVTVPESFAT